MAFPLSEVGSMEGSEQRGDTPDLGDYSRSYRRGGGVGGVLGGIRKLGAVMVPRVGVRTRDVVQFGIHFGSRAHYS